MLTVSKYIVFDAMVEKPSVSAFQNFLRIVNQLNIEKVMGRNVWMCFVSTALTYSIECITCFDLCINSVDKQHSIHYSMHWVLWSLYRQCWQKTQHTLLNTLHALIFVALHLLHTLHALIFVALLWSLLIFACFDQCWQTIYNRITM